jgi:metal-responsive CopG/Arc/MetJ family transcriptional regulator
MRLDRKLLDEVVKILGAKSRSEAIDMALRQCVAAKIPLKPSKPKIESPIPPGID